MAQQSNSPHEVFPHELYADSDHQVLLFPTRLAADGPIERPAHSAGRPGTTAPARVRARSIHQVIVLQVSGRLRDVVEDLDLAIQLALADEPRGVVCDLSAVLEDVGPDAAEVLATAGRHVRDWSGTPVAVATPDPQLRQALHAQPLGAHLIVAESVFCAVSAVLVTPVLTVERLRLAPHPTAPRASRDFVTRTLVGWQLNRLAPIASLVMSELVTRSSINACTDIDLSVAWNLGALRLTVREHRPRLPGQPHSGLDVHRLGLTLVAGLSRTFGALPTDDDGKVVWAVLDAPRPSTSTSHHRPPGEPREFPSVSDAPAEAEKQSGWIIERSHP
jgi:hypothetical protein